MGQSINILVTEKYESENRQNVVNACDYILGLTDNLITLDKVKHIEKFDIREMINFIIKMNEKQIRSKKVKIVTKYVKYVYQEKNVFLLVKISYRSTLF